QRLPLPGRMAAGAERRPPGPHRPGVLARPGRKDLRPAQTAGPGCRRVRLDPGGRPRLRLRRRRPHGPRRACRPARDHPRPWRPGRGRRPPGAGRPGRAGPLRARRLLNPPPHAASPGRVLRPADPISMARPDGPPPLSTTNPDMSISPLSPLEDIKTGSRFLRGTIAQELENPVTGAIPESDTKLLKFHGSYMQDDRDIRDERRKQKLEPAYDFMVRARLPGGVIPPAQWLALDELATKYAQRGLRITTRQTFQWHGILKRNLRAFMQGIHDARATTIAACGDVNRQVISSVNPYLSSQHALTQTWVQRLSDHFLPRTTAYAEIWLNGEQVGEAVDEEPIYGNDSAYLPRKFKIGVAIPPHNDCDVFANDLGLVAIIEHGELQGFNIAVGGGMGATAG